MRNALKIMTASLAAMALSASCAVHEWPETLPANATLKLDFDTAKLLITEYRKTKEEP